MRIVGAPVAAWFKRRGAKVVLVPTTQSADLRDYYSKHTKNDRLDSVVLARELGHVGVDVIDCSSGGLTEETRQMSVPRGLGFQVPFARRIREETGLLTQAVGMILDGVQAEEILRAGDADLIAVGREALYDPYWAHRAAGRRARGD